MGRLAGGLAIATSVASCSFHLRDSPPTPTPDAIDPGTDAAIQGDLLIEAEAFTQNVQPPSQTNAWVVTTTPAGYRGTALVKCGPMTGVGCPNDSNLDSCASHLIYDVAVVAPTTLHVHVRGLATSSSDDSVWYGIDGVAAPAEINFVQDSIWHYGTGDQAFVLAPGAHTVTLWQRECGVCIDQIALTVGATAPP